MYLQRHHLAALFDLAAADAEVCGVLLGRRAPHIALTMIVAGHNVHPTPRQHFLLDAPTLLKGDARARAAGDELIGFYHSHPNGSAVPSPHDRRDAWPGYVYLIVAVERGQPRSVCAWICDAAGTLRPEPLLPLTAAHS
ncbi:MAG TPA: M67 family metallopeptidase [Herpetosiphonaceae bacterium]